MKEQLLSESSRPCHSESRDKMGSMAPSSVQYRLTLETSQKARLSFRLGSSFGTCLGEAASSCLPIWGYGKKKTQGLPGHAYTQRRMEG